MSDIKKPPAKVKKKPVAKPKLIESAAGTVPKARFRRRHIWLVLSFITMVGIPAAVSTYYLSTIANDQYSSRVSFSIRSEEVQSPLEALGGLGQVGTGSSSDASILNEYLRSQKLVEDILKEVNLREVYSKPENDPVFAFADGQPIEDLVRYFEWMNIVTFDSANGLLDIESFAFTSGDAQLVSTAIMNASRRLVERLSAIAQEDTTRNAKLELEQARERLFDVREQMFTLRRENQTVDPTSDLASQNGILMALQSQLATNLVEYDLLVSTTRESDPRLESAARSIEAIRQRIVEERSKISRATIEGGRPLADVVSEFENLTAEREFEEQSYLAAKVTYDTALAEARRKSKYLAAHIPPTLAESSQYPNRPLWIASIIGICLLIWSITMLSVYAILDRR